MSTGWMCAESEEESQHHQHFSCDHRNLSRPQTPCLAEIKRWVCKYTQVLWQTGRQGLQAGAEGMDMSRK